MNKIVKIIQDLGIIPVIVLNDANDAEPLAQALCDGGLPCAEITFRTKAAEKSIQIIHEKFPNMLVGAGTVLTSEQVNQAENAGAQFIVSPGINATIVKYCIQRNIFFIPGVATPSDIELAMEFGLNILKFFPSELLGGIEMIKAMAAPYPGINFIPTGGINPSNLQKYLTNEHVIACGGTWMVKSDFLEEKNFKKITEVTKESIQLVREIKEMVTI